MKALHTFNYKDTNITHGYTDQTLYVNLTTNEVRIKPVSDMMKEKFIGGRGFGIWLLWESIFSEKAKNMNKNGDHHVKWDDPENEIIIANGPLGGSSFIPGSGKSLVTTISPLTDIVADSNVGGHFGPYLKHSGFDAIEIQGKSVSEVIIFIDGQNLEIKIIPIKELEKELGESISTHSHLLTQKLHHYFAPKKEGGNGKKRLDKISVVSTGPAAGNTNWGMLNFSFYKENRKWASYKQAGRCGIGTVFHDKKIRAIVTRAPDKLKDITAANKELLKKSSRAYNLEIIKYDPQQNQLRQIGTGYLPPIMAKYNLFPVHNYRYGKHPTLKFNEIPYNNQAWKNFFCTEGKGEDGCWFGCTLSCSHWANHTVLTGPYKGKNVVVDGPEYETIASCGSNWDVWDVDWVAEANFYCDTYGLDTISFGVSVSFVMECYEVGILNKERTDGLDISFGNAEAALELIHQMAEGKGFGLIVGKGIRKMKQYFAKEYHLTEEQIQYMQDIGMEHKGLEFSMYITRESLTQQGGYGMALKGPQHDEAWLIFEDIVSKSIPTFEDKAKSLCWFPYWRTWFGLNGLCKIIWNDVKPPDLMDVLIHDPKTGELLRAKFPQHVQWFCDFYNAITGRNADIHELIHDSKRVYNLQKLINILQGKGLREHDSNYPYRQIGPITIDEYNQERELYDTQLNEVLKKGGDITSLSEQEKVNALRSFRENQYHLLQDEVYKYRGWDNNGVPTEETLMELGLDMDGMVEVIKHVQKK